MHEDCGFVSAALSASLTLVLTSRFVRLVAYGVLSVLSFAATQSGSSNCVLALLLVVFFFFDAAKDGAGMRGWAGASACQCVSA